MKDKIKKLYEDRGYIVVDKLIIKPDIVKLTKSQNDSLNIIHANLKQFYNQQVVFIIIEESTKDNAKVIVISEPILKGKFNTYYRRDLVIGRLGGMRSKRLNSDDNIYDKGDVGSLQNFTMETRYIK